MDFKKDKTSIIAIFKKTTQYESDHDETSLFAHIDVVRYLLFQGLVFRDRDESERSLNKGNCLRLLKVIAKRDLMHALLCWRMFLKSVN